MAAPMQAVTEISLGILLVIGLLTRPAAFVAFLYLGSLWVSEWGTAWIWELLVPVLASLALAIGRAGRRWGIDARLAEALAVLPVVVSEADHVRISIVIPTHNEADAIGHVLADLPADLVSEVLVVDSNSTDGTPEIASKLGARVIPESRRGYGRA